MSDSEFDFIVVGAGIIGSWTAKHLLSHGRVLLLEQFREPHTRGSSHGQTRVFLSAHVEPFHAEMMPEALKMWRHAEAETNEELIKTTGVLHISDSVEDEALQDSIKNMKRVCPEHLEELCGKDIKEKYPSTLSYSEDYGFFNDKSGGVIYAHKTVRTLQKWFKDLGGIMWDFCKVTDIKPIDSNKVKIVTCRGDVFAKSVVISAGCWTKQLLKDLAPSIPLEPQVVKMHFWKEKEFGVYSASSGFPCIVHIANPCVYSLPSLEYPGFVKFCIHGGTPCNPDERDKTPGDPKLEKYLKTYIKEHFPLLEAEPSIIETCMYTCTPDQICVLDTLPGHKNVVIGTGFSGTGFKKSPVMGRLLSEVARGVEPFLDISPYRLSRFSID